MRTFILAESAVRIFSGGRCLYAIFSRVFGGVCSWQLPPNLRMEYEDAAAIFSPFPAFSFPRSLETHTLERVLLLRVHCIKLDFRRNVRRKRKEKIGKEGKTGREIFSEEERAAQKTNETKRENEAKARDIEQSLNVRKKTNIHVWGTRHAPVYLSKSRECAA